MPLDIFCGCTAWFMSDLVGNPEDRFSHSEAHIRISVSPAAQQHITLVEPVSQQHIY